MLPLAHLGHYLWIFYLIPVVIVAVGIVYSSLAGRRPNPDNDPDEPDDDAVDGPMRQGDLDASARRRG